MKTPIEHLLDTVGWERLPPWDGEGRYATHRGILIIGDLELVCYVLDDGMRVFDADVFAEELGANHSAGEEKK